MKKILILTLFIAFIYYSNAQEIKPNWIVIGNLEVALADLSLEFSQSEAWDELRKMDNSSTPDQHGWRLPTKDELNLLYQNRGKIGGFKQGSYWSSSHVKNTLEDWCQDFTNGKQFSTGGSYKKNIRTVRTVLILGYTSNTKEKINKIGNLEVALADLSGEFSWEDAKKECAKLGKGWRLPTQDELNGLYRFKDKIGGFGQSRYWTSEKLNDDIDDPTFCQDFSDGSKSVVFTTSFRGLDKKLPPPCSVRAVKTIK
jgi:hypothetical protein